MNGVNLAEELATFSEHWQPRTIGQFNGHDLMVVKAQGEFVWHKHDDTDDFFLVLKGRLTIELRDRTITLGPASCSPCPRGSSTAPSRRRRSTSC
jgi:mannose-6-phosphate isomerase-like protein (cupin superfamily)